MVGWGCWPRAGAEADVGCLPVACCSLSLSQLGRIFAMLELCQGGIPHPGGVSTSMGREETKRWSQWDGRRRILGGSSVPGENLVGGAVSGEKLGWEDGA